MEAERVLSFNATAQMNRPNRFINIKRKVQPFGKTLNMQIRQPNNNPIRKVVGTPKKPFLGQGGRITNNGPPNRYRNTAKRMISNPQRTLTYFPSQQTNRLGRSWAPTKSTTSKQKQMLLAFSIPDLRPFVKLPIKIKNKIIPLKWILDTGSQISIINQFTYLFKTKSK